MSNNSIWPIDRTLSGATTLGESGPGSDGNEGVPSISQKSRTGASPSDCLGSYLEHSFGGSYPPEEMLSMYSTALVNWGSGQPSSIFVKAGLNEMAESYAKITCWYLTPRIDMFIFKKNFKVLNWIW